MKWSCSVIFLLDYVQELKPLWKDNGNRRTHTNINLVVVRIHIRVLTHSMTNATYQMSSQSLKNVKH